MTYPISRYSAMSLIFLALAVALGAIGSHFLESKLSGGLLQRWGNDRTLSILECARINGFKFT